MYVLICVSGLEKKKLKPSFTLVAALSVPVTLNFLPLAPGVSVFFIAVLFISYVICTTLFYSVLQKVIPVSCEEFRALRSNIFSYDEYMQA
jgi:hypothetical protein